MVEKYSIHGWYEQDGRDNELRGEISINGKVVTGKILDLSSTIPGRRIAGLLRNEDKKTRLELLIQVPLESYCNIRYELSKPQTGNISGTYIGTWMAVGKKGEIKVTSGPHQAHSGEEFYCTEMPIISPRNKDKYPLKLILKK